MKAVLDTNVLVAAFVSDGLCRRLLLRARDRTFTLTISPFIRNEFARVLKRKVAADAEEIREALELLDEISTSADSTAGETGVTGICRDPDDDGVLACAVAAGAWSRRLTQEHRIVCLVREDRIDFLQARYHY